MSAADTLSTVAAIARMESPASPARPLACVDLFAGAGGFSLAARRCGIEVVAAVENDPSACATYKFNLVSPHDSPTLYETDIRTLDPAVLVKEHFSSGRACDLVLGGPPCQGFSVHRIKGAGVKDKRNDLILRYFDFVSHLKARVFLMENVPGLLWPRHRDFLDQFYAQGEESGYRVQPWQKLDARDYGVPQRRQRVFVLGIREDVNFAWMSGPQWRLTATRAHARTILGFCPGKPLRPRRSSRNRRRIRMKTIDTCSMDRSSSRYSKRRRRPVVHEIPVAVFFVVTRSTMGTRTFTDASTPTNPGRP